MVEQMLRDMTDAHVYNSACLIYICYIYICVCVCTCFTFKKQKNKKLPYDHRLHL